MQVDWVLLVIVGVLSFAFGALLIGIINRRKFKALRMEKEEHVARHVCLQCEEFEGEMIAVLRSSTVTHLSFTSGDPVTEIQVQIGCRLEQNRRQKIAEEGVVVATIDLMKEW